MTNTTPAPILREWVKPSDGSVRRYVNNIFEIIGLELGFYNTGNLATAKLNGEWVSNNRAHRILGLKVWLDESDGIHIDNFSECVFISEERIEEAVREALDASRAEEVEAA